MQDGCPRTAEHSHGQFSYKFQRLREQLRTAVTTGEFSGRMPGERELGRRFGANAKTINKALCDLASEGLVVRHIGRGTYVIERETTAGVTSTGRFRAIVDSGAADSSVTVNLLDDIRATLAGVGRLLECTPMPTLGARQTLLGTWPVVWRRETSGVFLVPSEPLENQGGRLDEASMSELLRRQMPMVIVGALSGGMKSCAVAPDYSDAGFRLCEHLAQAGCDEVVVAMSAETREAQIVAAGAAAAAKRYNIACKTTIGGLPTNGHGHTSEQPRGIICVGPTMVHRVMVDASIRRKSMEGSVLLAAMLAPGDDLAKTVGMPYYDVSRKTISDWASRIMLDAKPGQRPVEVIIPGAVRVPEVSSGCRDELHCDAAGMAEITH